MSFAFVPNPIIEPLLRLHRAPPNWLFGGAQHTGALDLLEDALLLFVVWRWIYLRRRERRPAPGDVPGPGTTP